MLQQRSRGTQLPVSGTQHHKLLRVSMQLLALQDLRAAPH